LELGKPDYLTPLETEKCAALVTTPPGLDRAWEYWCERARVDKL
jgi:hypothetical protein